jgi:hypothetical protein
VYVTLDILVQTVRLLMHVLDIVVTMEVLALSMPKANQNVHVWVTGKGIIAMSINVIIITVTIMVPATLTGLVKRHVTVIPDTVEITVKFLTVMEYSVTKLEVQDNVF